MQQQYGDKIIPQMYSVSLNDVEHYHLRLFLLNVLGAKNFEELQTVNGKLIPTLRKAA